MKKLGLVVIFIVIIIVIISSILYYRNIPKEYYSNRCSIKLTPEDVINYTVIVPLPSDWLDINDYFMLKEGNAVFKEITVNNSRALEIQSTDKTVIDAYYKSEEKLKGAYMISMYDSVNGTVNIFCNKNPDNSNLHISYVSKYSIQNGGSGIGFNGNLKNGYNNIKVELFETD